MRDIGKLLAAAVCGLAVGGMLAAHVVRVEAIRRNLTSRAWSLTAVAALVLIVRVYPDAYCLPVLALLTLVFTIVACGNSMFGILHWPASRGLGEVTYSIYLLHNFVNYIAFRLLLGKSAAALSPTAHWLIVCALAPVLILLSHTTFRLIEAPAMAAAPRFHTWLLSRWTGRVIPTRRNTTQSTLQDAA